MLYLVGFADNAPLARPPSLPDVPRPNATGSGGADPAGLAVSVAAIVAGGVGLSRGRRLRRVH
ncbi:MAG: hypothetical protein EHM13_13085 [Acidobacteria bacterium]|nr:MAG: hypothetical protein EHM13_13085 [Acidobacteriota bacterium]